jgi:hypothetical protein
MLTMLANDINISVQIFNLYLHLRKKPCWRKARNIMQWKPLIMITLGPALFDNNNRLITLSGGYKNLHYLTQFVVTAFTCIKNNNIYLKNVCSVACWLFAVSSS